MRSLFAAGLTVCLLSWGSLRAAESFEIVVNVSNPTSSLSKEEVSKIFFKKEARWESGLRVIPVDLKADHPTRGDFSKVVFGRSVDKIKAYWRKMVFSGLESPLRSLNQKKRSLIS